MDTERARDAGERPNYGEAYYRSHLTTEGDLAYERNAHWLGFFGGVAEEIHRRLAPRTVLDAGCAIGLLVECLRDRGIEADGFDFSEYAIGQAHESVTDHVWVGSITEPIAGRYDLVTCIEVIEHLPAADAPRAFDQLAAVTDRILLSTTPEDWQEPTHLNVQPPEYWSELLASRGFFRDPDFDASFLTPWASLYRAERQNVPELVRSHERERWRLTLERNALRAEVLRMDAGDEELASLRTTMQTMRDDLRRAIDAAHAAEASKGQEAGRRIRLEHELAIAEERIREMVDLLALLDQQVGTAKAAHEAFLTSRSYRLLNRVLAPYRRLRGG